MAKIKYFINEYGHLAVMTLCLVCCAVLLTSVVTDKPLVAAADVHVPVLRTAAEAEHQTEQTEPAAAGTASGFLLTEDDVEQKLADFLPDSFPASDIDAELEEGLLELSFRMDRADLKTYLTGQGADLGMLFNLLPRKLEADGHFALSADEAGLHLQPIRLELGDKAFDLSGLPAGAFAAIDEGLNALLAAMDVPFTTAEFTPEGILLK